MLDRQLRPRNSAGYYRKGEKAAPVEIQKDFIMMIIRNIRRWMIPIIAGHCRGYTLLCDTNQKPSKTIRFVFKQASKWG